MFLLFLDLQSPYFLIKNKECILLNTNYMFCNVPILFENCISRVNIEGSNTFILKKVLK